MGIENEGVDEAVISIEREGGMVEAVKYLQTYMNTYDTQVGYENYNASTFIDDILYGLGMALDPKKYQYLKGYRKFKEDLSKFLVENSLD